MEDAHHSTQTMFDHFLSLFHPSVGSDPELWSNEEKPQKILILAMGALSPNSTQQDPLLTLLPKTAGCIGNSWGKGGLGHKCTIGQEAWLCGYECKWILVTVRTWKFEFVAPSTGGVRIPTFLLPKFLLNSKSLSKSSSISAMLICLLYLKFR